MLVVLKRLDILTFTRAFDYEGECELSFQLVENDGEFSILMHVEPKVPDQWKRPYDVIVSLNKYTLMDAIRLCLAMRIVEDNVSPHDFARCFESVSWATYSNGRGYSRDFLTQVVSHPRDCVDLIRSRLPDWMGDILVEMDHLGHHTSWLQLTREVECGHLPWDNRFTAMNAIHPQTIAEIYHRTNRYDELIKQFIGGKAIHRYSDALFLLRCCVSRAIEQGIEEQGRDIVLGTGILFAERFINPRDLNEPITLDRVIRFLQATFSDVGGFRRRAWYRRYLPLHVKGLEEARTARTT